MAPDFNETTLYYVFSTTPQVIGAMIALITAFVHFRLARLNDYLVGDGRVIHERWESYEDPQWHRVELVEDNTKYKDRMRDAVLRKSVDEIDAVYRLLKDDALLKGLDAQKRATGIYVSYRDRFSKTLKHAEDIRLFTKLTSIAAISTIALSLICLSCVHVIAFYSD